MVYVYGERGYNQPHQFTLQENVLLPLDISLSPVFTWKPGPFMNDTVVIHPPSYLSWPSIYVYPPGTKQAQAISTFDLKLEKQFRYQGATLVVGLDVFNATNNYGGSSELGTQYGTAYGKRTYIKAPRTFQMSIRIMYCAQEREEREFRSSLLFCKEENS